MKEEGRSHPPCPPQGGKFRKKEEGRRKKNPPLPPPRGEIQEEGRRRQEEEPPLPQGCFILL